MNENNNINKMSDNIPLRLKIARMARGFKNRSSFATACGAAITTYRAHERGDYELKASDVIRYAQSLNISIPWLLTGEGHPLDHTAHPEPDVLAQFLYYLHLENSKNEIKESATKAAALLLSQIK